MAEPKACWTFLGLTYRDEPKTEAARQAYATSRARNAREEREEHPLWVQ